MTAEYDGELSDSELDAVLSAADDDLLAYIRSSGNRDAALLAIMAAGDRAPVFADEAGSEPAAVPLTVSAIAAGIRSFARVIELAGDASAAGPPGAGASAPASPGPGTKPQDGPDMARSESGPATRRPGQAADVTDLIRKLHSTDEAVEDLYLRTRQAADVAARSAVMSGHAAAAARAAEARYLVILAERPERRAPLARQLALALATVTLDGMACYFAALELGGSDVDTLAWTALFLGLLAGGTTALSIYRDRYRRSCRILAGLLAASVAGLGVLRYSFLMSAGGALLPAAAGACLSAVVTVGLLILGYRALRAAETPQAWKVRRQARTAWRAARAAQATAAKDAAARDHLIDTYLSQARKTLLNTYPASQRLPTEAALQAHLRQTAHNTKPNPEADSTRYYSDGVFTSRHDEDYR